LLPAAHVVAGSFMVSYVFGVGYLLVHLLRTRSRDGLVYTGLVCNSTIVVNDTLVALVGFGGSRSSPRSGAGRASTWCCRAPQVRARRPAPPRGSVRAGLRCREALP
jgi:hypothetical protein